MNDDHPTMGDLAYGVAKSNESVLYHLSQRVETLEYHHDHLVDVVNALLDHMYGPDDKGKPELVKEVIRRYDATRRD